MEVRHYITVDGVDTFQQWLDGLKDMSTRVVLLRRLDRVASGNFGDCKFCGDGVWELRVDYGPGYRIYYGLSGKEIVLLLCGGTKRTQDKDIRTALEHWADFKRRQA